MTGVALAALTLAVAGCGASGGHVVATHAKSSASAALDLAGAQRNVDRIVAAHHLDPGSDADLSSCPLGEPQALIAAAGLSPRFTAPHTATSGGPSSLPTGGSGDGTTLHFTLDSANTSGGLIDLPSPRVTCTAASAGTTYLEMDVAVYQSVSSDQFAQFVTQTGVATPTTLRGGQLVSGCRVKGNKVHSAMFETGCFAAWRPTAEHFVVGMGCVDNGTAQNAQNPVRDTVGTECRGWLTSALTTIVNGLATTAAGSGPVSTPASPAGTPLAPSTTPPGAGLNPAAGSSLAHDFNALITACAHSTAGDCSNVSAGFPDRNVAVAAKTFCQRFVADVLPVLAAAGDPTAYPGERYVDLFAAADTQYGGISPNGSTAAGCQEPGGRPDYGMYLAPAPPSTIVGNPSPAFQTCAFVSGGANGGTTGFTLACKAPDWVVGLSVSVQVEQSLLKSVASVLMADLHEQPVYAAISTH